MRKMRNSFFNSLADILLLTVAFVIFIASVLEVKDVVLLKQKFLKKIFQNTRMLPIKRVHLGRNICDEERGYVPFFNYTFPGVRGGSYNNETKEYSYRKCQEEEGDDCVNVPTINERYMTVWHDKVLCMKRMHSHHQAVVAKRKEDCPQGYRQCGYFNKFLDRYCVKKNRECPINFINFRLKDQIDFNDTTYEYIHLNQENYLVVSNNKTEEILPIDFVVGENYPCLESERLSFAVRSPVFPFINKLENYGCNALKYLYSVTDIGFDRRYVPLSRIPKKDFFFDNDLDEKYSYLPSVLNWENDLNSEQAYFYFFSRNYISVNFTCSDKEEFHNFEAELENFKISKYFQMVFALANIVLLCGFISLVSLVKIVKRWLHSTLTFIKVFFSGVYIAYNIYKSFENFATTRFLTDYIRTIMGTCVDYFLRFSVLRYGVIRNIESINFLDKIIYFLSLIYAFLTLVEFGSFISKVWLRIKNRERRAKAKKELRMLGVFDQGSTISKREDIIQVELLTDEDRRQSFSTFN